MERFNIKPIGKKGASSMNVESVVLLVLFLILVGSLASTAIVPLFNTTAFQCVAGNCSNQTGVPLWVVTSLGILGVIALVLVVYRSTKGGK